MTERRRIRRPYRRTHSGVTHVGTTVETVTVGRVPEPDITEVTWWPLDVPITHSVRDTVTTVERVLHAGVWHSLAFTDSTGRRHELPTDRIVHVLRRGQERSRHHAPDPDDPFEGLT